MKFSTKLSAVTITALLLFSLLLGRALWTFLVKEMERSQLQYARQTADLLLSDPTITLSLHEQNLKPLEAYFQSLIARQKRLLFIGLIDRQGAVLSDTSRGESSRWFSWPELSQRPTARQGLDAMKHNLDWGGRKEDVYLLLLPIFSGGRVWGFLTMGYSVSELFQVILPKLFTLLAGLWLGFFGLAALFMVFFIAALTRPIRDLEAGVKMLTSGNFDYPMNVKSRDELGKLGANFNHMRQSLRDTFAKLQSLSSLDEITHIYNHHIFNNLLDQELARARRYRYPLTLILVKVANYEQLANQLGPEGLKTSLLKITSLLQNCIRNTDNIARYQTQIFAIILPQSDAKGSLIIVDRMRRAAGTLALADAKGHPLSAAVQIGLATLEANKTAVDKAEFIGQAESSLAQESGQG